MATINHKTYNEATETFKDFSVYDGKETLIFKVDGADQTVYASNIIGSGIIKTSDNGPLSATAKYLSDGLGNNSALALSTSLVGVGATTLFTKMSIANSLSATSIGTNYNAGILNIQNTNTTNGNLSLIGFQDASASINLAAVGAINTVHSASPNSVVGELGFYTKASGGGYVTERMRITSTGNVGIGTSTPAAKLDVNQTNQSGDNDFIRLTTDATSGSLSLGIYPSSNNSLSFIGSNALFSAGGVTRLNAAAGGSLLSMNTDSIVTYVSSGAANPVERMRIDSSGNVGINTSAPTQKLTVNGNAAVGGQQAFWLRDDDGFSANAARRAWAMTANYNAFGTFSIYGASAVDSDPLAGTAFLNITSAGNVGIGTSTPTTAKLQIRGTGNTDATNSIFADNSSGAATFAVRDNGDVFMLGNVGIGTGTPTGKLHISGDGAAANLIRLQNTGSGTNGFFDISVTSTDAQLVANYSTTAIPMLFYRITSTGRGIGTGAAERICI
jgi:trimeric autotransporter adhesin